jgi:hypothetical protein
MAPKGLALALLLVVAGLEAGCGDDGTDHARPASEPLPAEGRNLLFVVRGSGRLDDGKLTIEDPRVEWFTDRPQRDAGVMSADALVAELSSAEANPPNAELIGADADAAITIEEAQSPGSSLNFAYKVIRGDLPPSKALGEATVFIDPVSDPTQTGG